MKNKLKSIILGISIVYSFMVLILMLLSFNTAVTTVELVDIEENILKLNNYQNEVNKLEQNSCTKVIKDLINYYEETSYNGKVKLKDIYDFGFEKSFLSFFGEMKNNCNLTEEELNKYNFPTKFLTTSVQQDELLKNYYFQYELSFKDFFTRSIVEPTLLITEYKINRSFQLEIIDNLIEISNKEVDNNA